VREDWKSYYRTVYPQLWLEKARSQPVVLADSPYWKSLIALVNVAPKQALLDLGCGTGVPLTIDSALRGADVTSADLAEQLLLECRRNLGALDLDGRFLVADAEALPFTSEAFDIVCSVSTTWYLPDLPTACREMARVTKGNGRIVFDVINLIHPSQLVTYLYHLFSRTRGFALLRVLRNRLLGRPSGRPLPVGRYVARSPWYVLRVARAQGLRCQVHGFYSLLPMALPLLGERANLARHSQLLSYGVATHPILKWFGAKLVFVCTKQ
jgi:SAM-dependent methyltransferase